MDKNFIYPQGEIHEYAGENNRHRITDAELQA